MVMFPCTDLINEEQTNKCRRCDMQGGYLYRSYHYFPLGLVDNPISFVLFSTFSVRDVIVSPVRMFEHRLTGTKFDGVANDFVFV